MSKPLATKVSTHQLAIFSPRVMWLVSVTRSQVWMGSRCVKFGVSLSLSHTGHWKFNMAPRGKELSEDLKKELLLYIKSNNIVGYKKIAKTLKLSCSTVAKTIQRLTGQVPLRTGLAMVDQRSWVHMLSVISRGCVWDINVWVLPALLLKGWGVSLSVLRPYITHCIKLVCMAVVSEGSLF